MPRFKWAGDHEIDIREIPGTWKPGAIKTVNGEQAKRLRTHPLFKEVKSESKKKNNKYVPPDKPKED